MGSLLLVLIYVCFISLGLPDSLLGSAWPILHEEIGVPISYAGIISGLLTGAGVGTLVLFRYNDSRKKSAFIIAGLYLIGVIVGFVIQGIELLF